MPIDREGNLYSGETNNGIRHGVGKYTFPHGGNEVFTYAGKYETGVKRGGKFVIAGVSTYEGEFDGGGEMTGKGKRTWVDGRVYEGDFVKGEQTGYGRWEKNGTHFLTGEKSYECYEGDFIDNVRQGQGTYTDGKFTYTGLFSNHKFNGAATVTGKDDKNGSFTMKGAFLDNKILGKADVTYFTEGTPESVLQCDTWQEGQPTGIGSYIALQSEYVYKGTFEEGIPRDNELSSYAWAKIDRADLIAQEEAEAEAAILAAGGKPGKKAPPKKGEEGTEETVVPQGKGLGSLMLRTGGPSHIAAQKAELEALANDPKAAKGKGKDAAAALPSEGQAPPLPEPPADAPVPNELQRKFRLTVRKVLPAPEPAAPTEGEGDEEDGKREQAAEPIAQYSKPITFWLRNLSQEELAMGPERFPLDCFLYENGVLASIPAAGGTSGGPEGAGAEGEASPVPAGDPPSALSLEGGAEAADRDEQGSLVRCHRVPLGAAVSFSVDAENVSGASEGLCVTGDFKMDSTAATRAFLDSEKDKQSRYSADIAAHQQAEEAAAAAAADVEVGEEGCADGDIAGTGGEQEAAPESVPVPVPEPGPAPVPPAPATSHDVCLLSLSHQIDGVEVSSSGLELVLCVPAANFEQPSTFSSPEGTTATEGEGQEQGEGEGQEGEGEDAPKGRALWQDCTLVLRLRSAEGARKLRSWALKSPLAPADWHSVSLALAAKEGVTVTLDGSVLGPEAGEGEGEGEGEEGTALAWLPPHPSPSPAPGKDVPEPDAASEAKAEPEPEPEPEAEAEAEAEAEKAATRLLVRAGGPGFTGALKLLALLAPSTAPHYDAVASTACYAQWRARELAWGEYKRADWYERAVLQAKDEAKALSARREELEQRIADLELAEQERLASLKGEGEGGDASGRAEAEAEAEAPKEDEAAAIFEQKVAELRAALAAPPGLETFQRTVDIPRDCKAEQEVSVFVRRGVLEAPFTRMVLPVDCPLGDYVLCIEDAVPAGLKQTSRHQAQKLARAELAKKREEDIASCQAALDESLAAAPPASDASEEGEGATEDPTVSKARVALEEASKPLALTPRALGELGQMRQQVLSVETLRIPFRLADPREGSEE